jgi:hypothetical protein
LNLEFVSPLKDIALISSPKSHSYLLPLLLIVNQLRQQAINHVRAFGDHQATESGVAPLRRVESTMGAMGFVRLPEHTIAALIPATMKFEVIVLRLLVPS